MQTRVVLEGYFSNSAFFLLIFLDLQAHVSQGQELKRVSSNSLIVPVERNP